MRALMRVRGQLQCPAGTPCKKQCTLSAAPAPALFAQDEHEREGLMKPIERQMWKLEVKGPKWTHPTLKVGRTAQAHDSWHATA